MTDELDKETVEKFLAIVINIEEKSASSKGKQISARRDEIKRELEKLCK